MNTGERGELLLRVDRLAGRLTLHGGHRESAGDQHAVAVADHRNPEPGQHQGPEVLPRHLGVAGHRGRSHWTTTRKPSVPAPTARVSKSVPSTTSAKDRSWATKLSPSTV